MFKESNAQTKQGKWLGFFPLVDDTSSIIVWQIWDSNLILNRSHAQQITIPLGVINYNESEPAFQPFKDIPE